MWTHINPHKIVLRFIILCYLNINININKFVNLKKSLNSHKKINRLKIELN